MRAAATIGKIAILVLPIVCTILSWNGASASPSPKKSPPESPTCETTSADGSRSLCVDDNNNDNVNNNDNNNNNNNNSNSNINSNSNGANGPSPRTKDFLTYWDTLKYHYDDWGSLIDLGRITDKLNCDATDYNTIADPDAYSSIPTDDDYSLLVEAYVQATKKNPNARNRPPSVERYNPDHFLVPVEIKAIPHIGRGVFATEDIAAGTMVTKPTNAMEFYNTESVRDFLAYLVEKESPLFCDVFLWLYATRKTPEENDFIVCLDADHTSLINSGDDWGADDDDDDDDAYDDDDDDDAYDQEYDDDEYEYEVEEDYVLGIHEPTATELLNIGQKIGVVGNQRIYGCQDPPIYALKDIKAGEELRMSYGDFSEPNGFLVMGMAHIS